MPARTRKARHPHRPAETRRGKCPQCATWTHDVGRAGGNAPIARPRRMMSTARGAAPPSNDRTHDVSLLRGSAPTSQGLPTQPTPQPTARPNRAGAVPPPSWPPHRNHASRSLKSDDPVAEFREEGEGREKRTLRSFFFAAGCRVKINRGSYKCDSATK